MTTTEVAPDTTPVDTPAVETPAPELSADEAAMAAMDEGVAEATPEPAESASPAPEAKTEAETPAAEPVPGTPEAAAADAAKTTAEAAKPEPDADTEAEIAAMEKAAGKPMAEGSKNRFREMAGEVKTLAPIKAELEKAGVTDIAAFAQQVPVLLQRAKDYGELIGMVQETKATPEQYGYTLDYLRDANAAIAGDMAAAQRAFDKATGEVAAWAQLLGKEVPGVHDPLKAHADLLADVEKGDITRDRALEIAQQRTALAINQTTHQHETQAHQHETDVANGTAALNQLGATLATADPDFARKQPFLLPTLRVITQTMPPNQWVVAAQQAYSQIPAMPAPAPTPTPPKVVPVGPVRPGSHRPTLVATSDDPLEAMNQGIAAANG